MIQAEHEEMTGKQDFIVQSRFSRGRSFFVYLIGIYVAYMLFGIAQERVVSHTFGPEHERFRFPLFLITVYTVCNFLVALICRLAVIAWKNLHPADAPESNPHPSATRKLDLSLGAPVSAYVMVGFSYILGILFSNTALMHVDFPFQVLAKSCKMVAVMGAAVIAGKRYPASQYLAVFVLTSGIFVFSFFRKSAGSSSSSGLGIALLIASLVCDGLTNTLQDKYVARYRPSSLQLMMGVNLFSALFAAVALVGTGQLFDAVSFIRMAGSDLAVSLALVGLASGVGQVFLYGMIRDFGSLATSVTTTTRKFFTILLSVIIYGHVVSVGSWVGVGLVFAGLGINIVQKAGKSKRSKVTVDEVKPILAGHGKTPVELKKRV
ncbi:UAA transporter [Carpediemonas membranifera]|uniref:UAA transporter n=1 Tax=Carpediemonas membranifera TaxID=201153 RepID=A0A8J6BTR8_9EUKA|nr:UAA transporter [Carpediemonas membranifera]|eukprot:KAG9389631.1 UAA transporter [Carpediemonas membranifera]